MNIATRPATREQVRVAPLDDPHAAAVERVAAALDSHVAAGLDEGEAQARLEAGGPNRLERSRRPPYPAIVARQFADPLVLLLVAAAAVSAAIGDRIEAAVIGAIVVLNAVLGFVQEAGAERAVLALRESLERHASVIRSGREREVAVEQVVPGDLVVLREGERVPADARVVDAYGLAADESLLTGESVPSDKSAEPTTRDAALAERTSMVFAGTAVTRGRGLGLVTATGPSSELGAIAGLTAGAKPPPTPLQRRVAGLTRLMVVVGAGVTLGLGGAMLARGETLEQAFLVGVSVAVAAVPEGLAATVTIALALGARAMAERRAIVRRLDAVETVGSATVVASDKTGTLTENRLRLAAVRPAQGRDEAAVVSAAALASTARIVEDEAGLRAVGDPVDGAIVLAAHAQGLSGDALLPDAELVRELPFDAERRRMTVVYAGPQGLSAYAKGAPEVILGLSREPAERPPLQEAAEAWAAEGLRVLAVAERRLAGDEDDLERDLDLVGLVALHDPLRPDAGNAVSEALAAGLRVDILTGDHPATAKAIGQELSLPESAIHARITPADKLRLVEALQARGEVVAVTGDGVNDSPALRRADVGIAMGRSGTEAAREAADIVLTDDDFATIVSAIREGRAIADNIRKFVAFLLSANLGEVALFAATIPAGLGIPMTVVQVLLVNILTDGLPAVALTRDPPSPDTMTRPPDRGRRLFGTRVWVALAGIGALVGGAAIAAFLLGDDGGEQQTMAFATIALAELALVYSLRSGLRPAWCSARNRYLAAGVALSALVVVAAVYLPGLQAPLGTVALGLPQLGVVLGLAVAPAAATELAKAVARRL
ncbi:MAG TPA: cation-transporting P-type ATPase [Gaiellaceae bacterium]|jgi:Ca2+-transporting ATPase|nr:cation-transporting P-type ATPase [Gaiellaceae bacterium]